MRYILIILVFLSVGAKAQMVIKAHANYRPYAQPAANLLLDDYPNAAAAYSLRKLDKDYTGACIRIRRDSVGQSETDIGFDASGIVDTNAIKNFVGDNFAAIVTWYDQSGNGRNMSQSTAANQPTIKNDLAFGNRITRRNNKPSIFFDSINNVRLSASRILSNDEFSIFGVVGLNVVQTNKTILAQHAGAADIGRTVFLATGTGADNDNALVFFNNGTSYSAVTTNTYTIATPPVLSLFESESNNLGTTTIKINGTGTGTISGQTWTPLNTNTTIGAFGNGNNAMFGAVSEIIIYSTKQANADGIRNNINDYYNIYWNGDFTGILDTYPNSAAAYSLRNLSSTYTGPLIRVRKDTTGQPEIDVYGDYYGNLDTVGLKNFLLTRSGFVTTWYDQSGNGRNASQSTQANQPRIANLGIIDRENGKPSIVFDGSNDGLFTNSDITYTSNDQLILILNRPASTITETSSFQVLLNGGSPNSPNFDETLIPYGSTTLSLTNERLCYLGIFENLGAPGTAGLFGYGQTSTNISGQNLHVFQWYGTTVEVRQNSNTQSLSTATEFSSTRKPIKFRAIGYRQSNNSGFFNGEIQEVIIWGINQNSNKVQIENNINAFYSIY